MTSQTQLPTLDDLLQASAATDAFSETARSLAGARRAGDLADREHIAFNSGSPPVKVLRTIMQFLETEPRFALESVSLDGQSGCSDFRGRMTVRDTEGREKTVSFVWDCAWRARQEGLKDFMGFPDQQRAAREFGFRCFEVFDVQE